MWVFFSSQLPALSEFKIRERQQIIAIALSELSASSKVLLRIAKLFLLIPVFFVLACIKGWLLLPFILLAGLCYPLLTVPVEIMFAKPHLTKAIQQFKQGE
ncbi:MAG: DUF6170 family protein [Pseudoalteromonas sp.]|uniref:DUF6170 family protein n=1 Tax=unclassified Pseudoalteromonas TaxID=194690 RepID=UPI003F98DFD2